MNKQFSKLLGIFLTSLAMSSGAYSSTIVVSSGGNFGTYFQAGNGGLSSAAEAVETNSDVDRRGFFSFDLSSISGSANDVTLNIDVASSTCNPFPGSCPGNILEFGIYSVGFSNGILAQSHSSGDAEGNSIYGDLASGTLYGTFQVVVNTTSNISISLLTALPDINLATSDFSFGIDLLDNSGVFTGAGFNAATLELTTIPLPAAWILFSTASILLFGVAKRKGGY